MSDLVIKQDKVEDLKKGFSSIRDMLSLDSGTSRVLAKRENVGFADLVRAVNEVNDRADSLKVKYQKKTKKYIDFLQKTLDESTRWDAQTAKAARKKEIVHTRKRRV